MHRKIIFGVLALVLLAPMGQAWHLSSLPDPGTNVVDIRNRVLATNTVNLDNHAAGNLMTFTFPWDPEYSYQPTGHTIRVRISYTAIYPQSSDGAWLVNVAKEATGDLASCSVRVETLNPVGITLDNVPVSIHFSWDCLFTQSTSPHYHYHTIYINRTVASGTPAAMSAESVSVRLEAEDVVLVGNVVENITDSRDLIIDALTGFNATELERALTILMAIQDNSTLLNFTLADILLNLTEHREHTIEVATMNDFNGAGFDGFLINCLLLAIYVAMFVWSEKTKTMVLYISTIIYGGLLAVAINNELGNSVVMVLLASVIYLIVRTQHAKSEMGE